MSDPEIVCAWLGRDHPRAGAVIAERDRRYRARTADGSTIPESVRARRAPGRRARPVAVCSGAARSEIASTLDAAGIARRDPPDRRGRGRAARQAAPDGYAEAHRLLAPELPAADVLAFEDTEVGVVSALAAGLRCIAVLGTMRAERLAAAERIVPALDSAIVREALGLSGHLIRRRARKMRRTPHDGGARRA